MEAAGGGYDGYGGGAAFAQDENRNGYETHGEYRVQLPDGRTQIVTYHADHYGGNVVDVKYEGKPTYPDHHGHAPVHHKPAPHHSRF